MEQKRNINENSYLEDKHRLFASKLSLTVGVSLLFCKFWAYNITHSQAVLSDALESIINVVGAALLIFVIRYGAQPLDQDHPYGHGKVEYFSAAFEGGLISFAGVFIILEAIRSFLFGGNIHELSTGVIIVAFAGLINMALGLYLKSVGNKKKSMALIASGTHLMTDFWTSLGLVGGLLIIKYTGIMWLDPVIAIVVGVFLLKSGISLVKDAAEALMDKESLVDLNKLVKVFNQIDSHKIIQIHHAKLIRSGRYHHIDAHLVVPEFWTVNDVHNNIVNFEKQVIQHYDYEGELNFHLDPCRQAYCRFCDVNECPIRKEDFKEKILVCLDHMRNPEEPEEFIEKN